MQAVERYSKGAIALHWLIALALAGELALGFAMPKDASGFAEYQLHKSIGISILLLSLVRLGWRLTHKPPAPLEGGITGLLASVVKLGFYVFMIGMPLTGWALVSSDSIDVPTVLFGVIPLPHLPLGEGWNDAMHEAHELLAWGGLALFVLHVVGALRHHFVLKDALLARIGSSAGMVLGMLGLTLALGAGVLFVVGQDSGSPAEPAAKETTPAPEATPSPTPASEETAGEEPVAEEETATEEAGPEEAVEPVAVAPEPVGPPPSWTIQPGGALRFSVDNAGSALNGSFANWRGTIAMDPDAPESAAISITVDLASASLGDATQDSMLSGAEFFDTASFPQATWRSTAVRRVSGNSYEADGTLSLKGASRAQRISFTLNGSGSSRSVEGSATIDRNAFAVGTGSSAENLAGSVRVTFAFDAAR